MAALSTVLAVGLGAMAGATIYSAEKQAKAQKEQIRMQQEALKQQEAQQKAALEMQAAQQRQSQEAMNAANRKSPDISGMMRDAGSMSGQGLGSTMLTGPGGAALDEKKLGRSSLLGG